MLHYKLVMIVDLGKPRVNLWLREHSVATLIRNLVQGPRDCSSIKRTTIGFISRQIRIAITITNNNNSNNNNSNSNNSNNNNNNNNNNNLFFNNLLKFQMNTNKSDYNNNNNNNNNDNNNTTILP